MRVYVPRDAGAVAVGADEVALAFEQAAPTRGRRCRDRPHRLARAATGWSRWSRSRPPQGRIAYGPVTRGRRRRPARCDGIADGAASAAARCRRRDSLAEAPDPPDLRALRRHRSAVARRLPRPWRLQGPRARADARRRRDRRGGHRSPACAAAAAPASRPASSGRPWRRRRPTANTSSAMPTRATAAPSPTA